MSKILLRGYEVNFIERNPRGSRLIVLLHGFGASTFSWLPIMDALAELGHVVAYDRPGFGQTERPMVWQGANPYSMAGQVQLLDAIITHFGDGREVILVGHSAGGQLAADYLFNGSKPISKLILESPAILTPGPPRFVSMFLRLPIFNKVGPKLVGGFARIGQKILFDSFYDKPLWNSE